MLKNIHREKYSYQRQYIRHKAQSAFRISQRHKLEHLRFPFPSSFRPESQSYSAVRPAVLPEDSLRPCIFSLLRVLPCDISHNHCAAP